MVEALIPVIGYRGRMTEDAVDGKFLWQKKMLMIINFIFSIVLDYGKTKYKFRKEMLCSKADKINRSLVKKMKTKGFCRTFTS